MKSLKDFVAKKSLSSDTLSKIASKTRFCSTHAKNPRAIAFGFFILAGHGLEPCFPVGNGFSDGKNEANRLVLGIKPRRPGKAVFGRVARNTPPGRLRLAYLAPLPKPTSICFRAILFRRPASGRRNLHFGLVFFRYL